MLSFSSQNVHYVKGKWNGDYVAMKSPYIMELSAWETTFIEDRKSNTDATGLLRVQFNEIINSYTSTMFNPFPIEFAY